MNILSIITGNPGMLLAMQVVLVIIGLSIVARLLVSLKGSTGLGDLVDKLTQPVLNYVFPLILISLLTSVDTSGFLVMIGYYLTALFVAIKEIMALIDYLKQLTGK